MLVGRGLGAGIGLLAASALVPGTLSVAATPTLTSANSIVLDFVAASSETFAGTGCGGAATIARPLPVGSSGIRVVEPAVGDRDSGRATRVTAVAVEGTVVKVTIVADGSAICDPDQTGVPAGEPVNWHVDYDVRAEYTRRVQTTMRVFFESYLPGAKWQMRPRTIRDSRRGAPPGMRVSGITWRRFGGRTAVGFGTLRLDYCRRGDNCPQNGKRVRLVARNAALCRDSRKVEYRDMNVYIGKLDWAGLRLRCS